MPLGVHASIAGGLDKAVGRAEGLGCDCLQMFFRNPRGWDARPISKEEAGLFRRTRERAGFWPVAVHTAYLINLSSPDERIFRQSRTLLKEELRAAERLGADYLVTHLGSPRGSPFEKALERITSALEDMERAGLGGKTRILFENSAGGGDCFGAGLDELGAVMDAASETGLDTGFCLDTCHAFAAGYPMKTPEDVLSLVERVREEAGLRRLKLIHLNDSKTPLGSRVDRHEHLGRGTIGRAGLKEFINRREFRDLPFILETPKKDEGDDIRNLRAARRMMGRA